MLRQSLAGLFLLAFLASPGISAERQTAIFAGGCFWCVESDFDHVNGVTNTVSGYIGGSGANPTYKTYASMGYREAVKITFDSRKISYEKLVDIFFHSVDPTDAGGQFCDRGHSYTTAIYTTNKEQAKIARMVKKVAQSELGKSVVTPIRSAGTFYSAETYHQNYYRKHPLKYKFYRTSCRRDSRIESLWGSTAHRGLGY